MDVDLDAIPARRSIRWRLPLAAVAVVLALLGWNTVRNAADGPDASAPTCGWTATINGASTDQAGLIRCYLKAIAEHSSSGLRAVARSSDIGGPAGFTDADFVHSADARSGTATATVAVNSSDSADAIVTIRYANGAHDEQEIALANPRSAHSWRFWAIGGQPVDPSAPPSAAP